MTLARHCEACGSPLAHDQRYCLLCGTRAGGRGPQLEALIERVRERAGPDRAGVTAATAAAAGPASDSGAAHRAQAPRSWPRLPGPWVSVLLVLVFVGFGALLGDAGAGTGRLTAATPSLKVLVPPSPGTNASTGGGSAGRGSGAAEAPSSQAEETPSSAEGPESPAPASSSSESSGSGETGKSAPNAGKGTSKPAAGKGKAASLRDIKHVFVIVLSNEPYAALFGPESKGAFLAHTLESKGELLLRYDAIAHEQLPNGVALLSGQGPTAQTAADCPSYTPGTPGTPSSDEQVLGDGCVYPAGVQTLPGQLVAKHLTWRAYVQGIDEGAGTPPACSHPPAGAPDASFASGAYATYRNPFVYFQSITSSASCAAADVGLDKLGSDLRSAASTPAFSYIVPDRCHDGGPTPCVPGAPAGAAGAGQLLSVIVPQIMASQAYKKGGMLVITTDEAPSTGEFADSSSCCGQPPYPNLATAGLRHGGGAVGALLLSPFVKGGTTSPEPYNHYSLLRTIEDVFGLGHIGYAALPSVNSFSAALLNAPARG
jgi:hypothetical protein